MVFRDRHDAGRRLAGLLADLEPDTTIYALPRGGVPVAYEIATAHRVPLDILVVRKLGVPGHRELGFGAIAEGGATYINEGLVRRLGISQSRAAAVASEESAELERRARLYREGADRIDPAGRVCLVVDDGLATGATARAAARALRQLGARRVELAVPVASPEVADEIQDEFDRVTVFEKPRNLMAVGQWYQVFDQTSDAEVMDLLRRSRETGRSAGAPGELGG